jgi:large subunit ribosomal protein L20
VFRSLWIIRISAAVAPYGLSYSVFMGALHRANVALDRKILSEMAIQDPKGFEHIIEVARQHLPALAKVRV